MTEPRAPLSFSAAVHIIADLISYEVCAAVTGRMTRLVREWSDSSSVACPSIEDCLNLDLAFLAAGGGYAPMHECLGYRMQAARGEAIGFRSGVGKVNGEQALRLECLRLAVAGKTPSDCGDFFAFVTGAANVPKACRNFIAVEQHDDED